MANITKRANGTYLIRVSCGLDENGKPIQRSKTFHPSSLSLSESKKQKELEQFIFEFESEVKANADIINALEKEPTHIRAVISVALYTGARRGEIVCLKWDDIDLDEGTLSIKRSVYKPHGEPAREKPPKTVSSIRTIAIPQVLCDILREHKSEQDKRIAYLGDSWYHGNYVFTEADGHVMNPQTPTKQFDHFLKRHGIRHLKFHGLRHTSATLLLANGCDIKTVSSRLGHTSIDTTNIYLHVLAKADKAAADCFDKMAERKVN